MEHVAEVDDSRDFNDGPEEAMPGFYEHEDEVIGFDEHDDDADLVDTQLPPDPPRKPSPSKPVSESRVFDIAKTAASSTHNARINAKPRSTSTAIRPKSSKSSSGPARNSASESLTCPVCGKDIQTDNEGLNSHIDFCLSRGAIRQAHAEASTARSTKTSRRKEQIADTQLATKRMGNG